MALGNGNYNCPFAFVGNKRDYNQSVFRGCKIDYAYVQHGLYRVDYFTGYRRNNMVFYKTILGLIIMLIMANNASAFSFKVDLMGYTISYAPEQEIKPEIINNVETLPKTIGDFSSQINQLNDMPQITNALLLIGYSKVGFTDTDTMQRYVITIDENGKIIGIYQSQYMQADAELKGSAQKITDYVTLNDYERLKLAVDVPFKIKLRIL